MKPNIIAMSDKELDRHDIIRRLIRKELNESESARLISVHIRQVRRMKKRVLNQGPQGLIHGNRGRPSNNRVPKKELEHIINILTTTYPDFKPTHASEKLQEVHGIRRDPKTVRRIMIGTGLWKPRRDNRKQEKHRAWRLRKAFFGEMEQFDGSYHPWFEDRLPGTQCLLLAVDDATGNITLARFDEHEGVFPVFRFWQEYLQKHGRPMSVYMDRFSTYSMNQKTARENPDTQTQFQRAMQELRIQPILAHSPQAKGRVETIFRTLQDRLVKEMRLRGISSIEEANDYLVNEFIPWYDSKYAVKARGETNLHKKLTKKEQGSLPHVFARHEGRVVQNDFTISFRKQWYQILSKQRVTVQKRDRVRVEEHLDGSTHFILRGKTLNVQPILKEQQKRARQAVPLFIPASAGTLLQNRTFLLPAKQDISTSR